MLPRMKKMKKEVLFAIIGVVVLLLVIGGAALMKRQADSKVQASPTSQKKKKITDPVNVIAVAERPYVRVTPKDSKNVTIEVKELKKPATSMEYELEYQTESNLEGAIGDLTINTLPAMKDILLGSCSAGGACRYHKDVKGGTLLGKFSGGDQSYALKQDWKYIENTAKETTMSSRDAKFSIESKDLAKVSIGIIYNSPGYPGTLPGTPISEIYTFAPLGGMSTESTVSIRMSEDAAGAVILSYDGKTWKEMKTTVADKVAKATGITDEAYVVVKK